MPYEAVRRHLQHLRLQGLSEDTITARRRALIRLRTHLRSDLTEATADQLMAWREGLTVAPKTIGTYISHVSRFYDWAVGDGLLPANPARGLPVPRPPRRLPRPIAEQDLMAAVAGAPERIRPWLVLAGWAGLRAKEIALLRRENVLDHTPQPMIIVAADATKGITERIVPLSAFVLAELAAVLPGRGWVFRRADGRPGPNAPWTVSHLANEYLHEMGISATLHQLRHRFGSSTYQATKDLRLVQELMGHLRPETTAGYAAYDQASAAAAVEALPVPAPRPLGRRGMAALAIPAAVLASVASVCPNTAAGPVHHHRRQAAAIYQQPRPASRLAAPAGKARSDGLLGVCRSRTHRGRGRQAPGRAVPAARSGGPTAAVSAC